MRNNAIDKSMRHSTNHKAERLKTKCGTERDCQGIDSLWLRRPSPEATSQMLIDHKSGGTFEIIKQELKFKFESRIV